MLEILFSLAYEIEKTFEERKKNDIHNILKPTKELYFMTLLCHSNYIKIKESLN